MSTERRTGILTKEELTDMFTRLDESFQQHLRSKDAKIAVLEVRQQSTDSEQKVTSSLLTKHILECAKLQKWAFGVLLFLAGWTVAHSPEVGPVVEKLLKVMVAL